MHRCQEDYAEIVKEITPFGHRWAVQDVRYIFTIEPVFIGGFRRNRVDTGSGSGIIEITHNRS